MTGAHDLAAVQLITIVLQSLSLQLAWCVGGLMAPFLVTPIQEMWPSQQAPPVSEQGKVSEGRHARAPSRDDPASVPLGSGYGHSWQLRLVVVQEALALLAALLSHTSLGGPCLSRPFPSS